ncbi:MAG: signal peptide peptidase SppA [Thermoguttaceae bacterium]
MNNTNYDDIYGVSPEHSSTNRSASAGPIPPNGQPTGQPTGSPIVYHQYFQSKQAGFGCFGTLIQFIIFLVVVAGIGFVMLMCMAAGIAALGTSLEELDFQNTPLTEKLVRGQSDAQNKVAIISIDGMIVESQDGFIPKQIRQVLMDESVRAVVLRVDSPGGTVSGSDFYLHLLREMKAKRSIPIVVSMGSMATSGGYYVSMASNKIIAEPTTITGSIGVIVALVNGTELCEKIGVKMNTITSGPYKAMGSFSKPMSEDEEKIWQGLVDNFFARFKEIICDGRKNFADAPEKLDAIATGQVYTASDALKNGLIDQIGFQDDAILEAMKLAGLNESDTKTIRYKDKSSLSQFLLEMRGPRHQMLSSKQIVDAMSPRLYLLPPSVLPTVIED